MPEHLSHSEREHRTQRLGSLPYEIGKAHLKSDHRTKALLYRERAEHLDALHGRAGGEHILLVDAHKDAAEHCERVGDKAAALEHYRKALGYLARTVQFRSGRSFGRTVEGRQETINRLQGILNSVPDKREHQRRAGLARLLGILGKGEEYKEPEVDVEKVRAEIRRLEREKRGATAEDEFQQMELRRMRENLDAFRSRIRHLENDLGLEHGKLD
jgi:hypothetical protein